MCVSLSNVMQEYKGHGPFDLTRGKLKCGEEERREAGRDRKLGR